MESSKVFVFRDFGGISGNNGLNKTTCPKHNASDYTHENYHGTQ